MKGPCAAILALALAVLVPSAGMAQEEGPKPVEVGSLRFLSPPGWVLSAEQSGESARLWLPPEGEAAGTYLAWLGPLEATGAPLEEQFANFLRSRESQLDVDKATEPRPFSLACKLDMVYVLRVVRLKTAPKARFLTFEGGILAGAEFHYFMLASGSKEAYESGAANALDPLLESLRREIPVIEPGSFDAKATRERKQFGCALDIPEHWQPNRVSYGQFEYLASWEARQPDPLGGIRTCDVYWEFHIGKVGDPRAALESWLVQRFGLSPKAERDRFVSRSVSRLDQCRISTGGDCVSMTIREQGSKWLHMLRGYLFYMNGCALWTGAETVDHEAGEANPDGASQAIIRALSRDLFAMASRCRFELPPVEEEWAKWLVQKGTFRRMFEFTYEEKVIPFETTWTFRADGACEIASNEIGMLLDGGWHQWYSPLSIEGFAFPGERPATKRFEVRGTGEADLWIVVYHETGLTTVHRLEPNAEKTVADTKFTGLAIDGQIEGSHFADGRYEPPK